MLSTPGGWTADVFNGPMSYATYGRVSFVTNVSLPPLAEVTISGPPQVGGTSTFQYHAVARYENSALREVTASATWSVSPPSLATIDQGLLTTLPMQSSQANVIVRADYSEGGIARTGEKTVLYRAALPEPATESWPMYQANARHTGHVALSLDPANFALRWQKAVGNGSPLNPVTAAEDKVFCSLVTYFYAGLTAFTLNAGDGSERWSKSFIGDFGGGPFSVNPPRFGYGNVYIQTGDHGADTWLRAYDATTGDLVFRSPHGAQWERYFAPTIFDGKVYLNGGYYGGAYGFDALTGLEQWFLPLPQYDQWTPAIDGDLVYCYVGEYTPGLYILDRASGALQTMIPDPNFQWDGWSMNLAPVVGRHSDVITIHDGRLINFDTASHTIRWEVEADFRGQPSVAHDRIFAIRSGYLAVLDEVTHAPLWVWEPPQGNLAGSLVVTDTHVFGSTQDAVYAVDLGTHKSVWSYPVGGKLALGNGTLYIAGEGGLLTAVGVVPPNQPPDCSGAVASIADLWPPNHQLQRVDLSGITDPDGDPVTVAVTKITQDEPLNSIGDGNTCPDGAIDSNGAAWVRSERQGPGNGRVYLIAFTATDIAGASCEGHVAVCIPHDHPGAACVDDGQTVDALGPCSEAPDGGGGGASAAANLRVLALDGGGVQLSYTLPAPGVVNLSVFDVAGRRVATVEHGVRASGRHLATWRASDMPAGVYFVRLEAGATSIARPVTLRP